ncbi:MAG: hypothetical protein ACYSR1_08325 [Planctomycetota bacterium]|jgi:hypothetical protein
MLSRLFFYCFIGIFFFASLTETVFSKERLTTGDPGVNPDSLVIQNKPSKAEPGKMSTETEKTAGKKLLTRNPILISPLQCSCAVT